MATEIDLNNARRQVIETARQWANNTDHRDQDLLALLRREVATLERIEKEMTNAFRSGHETAERIRSLKSQPAT